jgi:hypothetical protein
VTGADRVCRTRKKAHFMGGFQRNGSCGRGARAKREAIRLQAGFHGPARRRTKPDNSEAARLRWPSPRFRARGVAEPGLFVRSKSDNKRNLHERGLATTLSPEHGNAALRASAWPLEKRTHCRGRLKKTKALLLAVSAFSKEPNAAVRRPLLGQAPLQNKANASSAHRTKPSAGAAKGSLDERRLAAALTPRG